MARSIGRWVMLPGFPFPHKAGLWVQRLSRLRNLVIAARISYDYRGIAAVWRCKANSQLRVLSQNSGSSTWTSCGSLTLRAVLAGLYPRAGGLTLLVALLYSVDCLRQYREPLLSAHP